VPYQRKQGRDAGRVVLFALSTCPWCHKTKALLDSLAVAYEFIDVDLTSGPEREETIAAVRRWNPSLSFPVLVIGDAKAIIGLREADIREALGA
jgi:glutaredoxin